VAHSDRCSDPYKSRLLARNCYNNSKKERVGKEKRVRRWSSEALLVLRFIVSIALISTI
jgi:hypothetical protein